ncbi:MAG: MBL fold metallo-hydrolase, partial [Chloroflexi bacterium]|nr:MBL fold metallo-hydrolase [Chloroflexota bacterium]
TCGKAGTFKYMCAIHRELGMTGSVTVTPRDQASGPTNTVAFQDFGWDPDTKGASGSVTYSPIAGSFSGEVEVTGLKAAHDYNLYFMNVGVLGATSMDTQTFAFTTDGQGAAKVSVSQTFDVSEMAPLPAYQVHFLVVDESTELAEPPNPFGIKFPIALACSFPLGFLQLGVAGLPLAALSGDRVPLFDYGWAPGVSGGTGSVSYTGQASPFKATLTVGDLKPGHKYSVVMMGSPLNGAIETKEFILNTDSNGAASIAISHEFTPPEGVPLPAYQVHFLIVDRSETLDDPPNPFGIKNPIVLACMFPLGFVQLGLGPTTVQASAPLPATAMGTPISMDKGYLVEELGDGLYWVTDGTYQVMFATTGEGVIAVDAPPSMIDKYLMAIAEVTDEPVTHVIYSHFHADHIAGAGKFPSDAVYIAHQETASELARPGGPDRLIPFGTFVGGSPPPAPDVTFSDSFTLTVGNQTLELEYKGPNHAPGNIFIYAPKQRVLLLIDVVFPGWSPFMELALTGDTPAFIQAHDDILAYDFDVMVSGHLGRLATREDVETQKEYVLDMQANAAQALQTVDFMTIAGATGFENPWLLFDTYLGAVAKECADLTVSKWGGRLGAVDVFSESHCKQLMNSLRLD